MSFSRIVDLQCKEVINISDGCRLGYVCDVEIDVLCGKLVSIIVPGTWRLWTLFGRGEEYIIPWDCIEKIGEDIILVRFSEAATPCQRRRERRGWF